MLIVLSFGGAYLMSGPWRDLDPKPMVLSIISIVLFGLGALYVPPEILYIFLGIEQIVNYYFAWIGLTFFIGIPFMMFVFSRYD